MLCGFVDASVRNSNAYACVFATLATLPPLVTFTVLVTSRATLATLATNHKYRKILDYLSYVIEKN